MNTAARRVDHSWTPIARPSALTAANHVIAVMSTLDYIDVPASASRLRPSAPIKDRAANKDEPKSLKRVLPVVTSVPHPPPPVLHRRSDSSSSTGSPGKNAVNLLPQLLLSTLPSSAVHSGPNVPNPRGKQQDVAALLSSRDPLSVPILTVNFKRFVERVGPVFWLQDRIEEIVMWRRGWKVTGVWIAAYAFLCFFPRLLFLLPQIFLIAIILATHPTTTGKPPPATDATAETGSVDWQANIQAIQNLMGFVADAEVFVQRYLPYITNRSPQTPHVLTVLVFSLFPALALVSLPSFPVRTVALLAGILPFAFTHPLVQTHLPAIIAFMHTHADASPVLSRLRQWAWRAHSGGSALPRSWSALAVRVLDDANLTDQCWVADMREVELWENERYGTASGDGVHPEWSKANLRDSERAAWTRGRDGWSGLGGQGGVNSNLTFTLDHGWSFVLTEDWRPDLEASWVRTSHASDGDLELGDEDGWVYSNDSWSSPRPANSVDSPSTGGITRRRRWVRRIWLDWALIQNP
ncbi:unnamed protein product [Mycena citricolor]|uniref:Peroxin/Ferlin domain-containing protein n=1 Tax=Mycena citricolor TaxID=2018698 RepID=A0AAD2JXI8_9AGAR|nr:unnamed protein product [Mycena citricolor]